ncbi:MAG TPA: adenylate/guanylate cyclase domain-containing protein [Ktedonobacterales bacterium]
MPEERKLVTILFADVTGSTALGEVLDPEDVRALMGRYYQHARRVIAEHGGTLEKFIGDAVMAIFGLPQAHGNDAERALAAALALRDAVEGDGLLASRLILRTGVNTGEVVATNDPASGDFLVTGDAVNVAARLQQAAHPGEILAGVRTQAAAQASFLFGEARAIEVKGKSRPLAVFPLVGPRPARALSRPPLVGRRRELAHLVLLRDAALQERHPQLVSIVAPAGTGKSRLVEEFVAGRDPAEGWQVATARCLPYGQTLTYWPLRGLLDDLLGERFSLERVAEAFAAGGHSQHDAVRLAGLLLATLGVETGEQVERESTFNAWRLFVEALARQAPRIVVFEDLHWASESLLDLVEHITHPRTRAPLLIIVLSRPELLDRRPSWGGGRRSFTALALNTLSEAQTHQLIDQLVPDLASEAVRERIVERSGGNPFFAIELARGLAVRLADPSALDGDMLPDTVYEAVLARLDLLSAVEREVLQVAAVAGRTFRPPTLQAALPERDPSAIATALDGLLARDLLTPAEGEDDAYTFRHILFRDVAYGTLARAERIRLHMAVARWLEDVAKERLDEVVELLAYHYREAVLLARQSAVPLNVEVDAAQAVRYLERAAEVAVQNEAFIEAERFLHSALALAPEADHIHRYELLGDLNDNPVSVDAYWSAVRLWRGGSAPDPLIGARLLRKLLILYLRYPMSATTRPSDDVIEELRMEARRLAEAAADEDELWRVRVADLFYPAWRADPITTEAAEAGRALGLEAAAYFESRGDREFLSVALDGSAMFSLWTGAHQEVIETFRRCLAIPALSTFERGTALCLIAMAHCYLGEYEQCLSVVREVLGQLRPGDPVAYLGEATSYALLAGLFSGRWSELSDLVPHFEESFKRRSSAVFAAVRRGYLAELHLALARQDRAAADAAASVLDTALTPDWLAGERALLAAYREDDPRQLAFDPVGMVWPLPYPFVLMLMFVSERGAHIPPALLDVAAGRAHAERFDALQHCVQIASALAANDNGRLAAAIDEAETHGLIPHAARMRIVLAQRTGDHTQFERARPVLEWLGDRQFLHRLEEVQDALK